MIRSGCFWLKELFAWGSESLTIATAVIQLLLGTGLGQDAPVDWSSWEEAVEGEEGS